jgi:Tat protein translocase TatB subunit
MLQGSEIIIILVVALVVLGPKRLPEIARKLGQWSAELRKAARDLRSGLEAEVGDLGAIRDEIGTPVREIRHDLADVGKEVGEAGDLRRLPWVGPSPESGPTPEDALSDLDEIEGDSASRDEK